MAKLTRKAKNAAHFAQPAWSTTVIHGQIKRIRAALSADADARIPEALVRIEELVAVSDFVQVDATAAFARSLTADDTIQGWFVSIQAASRMLFQAA